MQLNLTGHHCQITPALRSFTTEKLERLSRFGEEITTVNVVLNVDKLLQTAEATLHIPGADIHASASSKDMYTAIDELIHKLEAQIKKYHDKHTNHHHHKHDEE
ncbi:MAG: ribosome-associated translation inhibitor RaiA [Gammaproteobacteria bacterium]|nr:ribosome-associated translation inhibitor RaiA [Gammaproteobacteria bacterium]